MRLLYQLSIYMYGLAILFLSLFSKKARLWIKGRRNWESKVRNAVKGKGDFVWIHCSSLGEFEQGRPVIDALSKRGEHVVLTFFSPSGYEIRKNYEKADHVFYLPLDTIGNARKWLNLIKPKVVFFVKYEFWFNFIQATEKRKIPIYLVSGIFRTEQYFFKWYGWWFIKKLKAFEHLFVLDRLSLTLLENKKFKNISVNGDTRIDRVLEISEHPKDLPGIEEFCRNSFSIVAGSTWPEDERIIVELVRNDPKIKAVIAPHDVDESRILSLLKKCGDLACRFSEINGTKIPSRIVIIDKIGILSSLYRYGRIAYIGGGFGAGIHNILEAAVYSKPVIFGPNYEKFVEAREIIREGGAVSFKDEKEFNRVVWDLRDDKKCDKMGKSGRAFIDTYKGGTENIIKVLEESKVL